MIKPEIMTIALADARQVVKDTIKARGFKPSLYRTSDISEAARELIKHDYNFIRRARRVYRRRHKR